MAAKAVRKKILPISLPPSSPCARRLQQQLRSRRWWCRFQEFHKTQRNGCSSSSFALSARSNHPEVTSMVVLDIPGLRGVLFAHAAKVRTEKALSSIIRVPRNKRTVLVRDVYVGDTIAPLTVSTSHLLGDRVVYLRDVRSSSEE